MSKFEYYFAIITVVSFIICMFSPAWMILSGTVFKNNENYLWRAGRLAGASTTTVIGSWRLAALVVVACGCSFVYHLIGWASMVKFNNIGMTIVILALAAIYFIYKSSVEEILKGY